MTPLRWLIAAVAAASVPLALWLGEPPVWTLAVAAPLAWLLALGLRRRWPGVALALEAGVVAAGGVLAVGVGLTAMAAFRDLQVAGARIAEAAAQAAAFDAPLEKPDFAAVMPALQQLDLLAGQAPGYRAIWYPHGAGLRASLTDAAARGVDRLVLPRLVLWLETELRAGLDDPVRTLDLLAAYLALGGVTASAESRALAMAALERRFDGADAGAAAEATRLGVLDRAGGLLQRDRPWIPLDAALVDTARQVVTAIPLAALAYGSLRDSREAARLAEWRPVEAAGPGFQRVFTHRSGAVEAVAIPGLFTRAGFHAVVLPALSELSATVGGHAEVLGRRIDAPEGMIGDVLRLYEADYIAAWEGMLGDLALIDARRTEDRAEVLAVLSGVNSPLRFLLLAVAEETRLTGPAPDEGERDAGLAGRSAAALRAILAQDAGLSALPGSRVEAHFAPFQALVTPGPADNAPLDDLLVLLEEAWNETRLALYTGAEAMAPSRALDRLERAAQDLPPPLDGWIRALAAP